jgi:1,4-dihydroxy-2-naphthoyl-CoA hydrolase
MAGIWTRRPSVEQLNAIHAGTAVAALGIEIVEVTDDALVGEMPVDARTIQPAGLLHGGASVLLAETLGSAAAMGCVDGNSMAVGMEINANHLKGVRSGRVRGVATPIRLGRTAQVWDIRITDEAGALVCVSRLSVMVVPRAPAGR